MPLLKKWYRQEVGTEQSKVAESIQGNWIEAHFGQQREMQKSSGQTEDDNTVVLTVQFHGFSPLVNQPNSQ
jgi:hypothetical protein